MTIEKLQELLSGDYGKVKEAVEAVGIKKEVEEYQKQYSVKDHAVMDTEKRRDKEIKDDSGKITKTEPVNRIGVPVQKMIASRAAAFLAANPIQLNATPAQGVEENMYEGIKKIWEDNKLDFDTMDIAEKMMALTAVAELWYIEDADDTYWANTKIKGAKKLRMVLLSKETGDDLTPVFDIYGDLIAFGRSYKASVDGKDEDRFDLYTDKNMYYGKSENGVWTVEPKPNLVGKIPIIYYSQKAPEWDDVQSLIERLETKLSNHADTNDYFDSPIVFITGELEEMAEKGSSGKVMVGSKGATAQYLAWDHAPESTKMEIENLLRFIYTCTDTPDISFENLKGLGTTSGFALEMMFMGAHLKAARHAGPFGKCIQRRINYLKAAMTKIDKSLEKGSSLSVKPTFDFYMPKDLEGLVTMLTTAVQGGILSKKTAVNNLTIVTDKEAELEQIKDEKESAGALNEEMT